MESGDESKLRVRMANLIVRNLAVLLMLAYDRGVFWIVEQPGSSNMWNYSPMQHCLVYRLAGQFLVVRFIDPVCCGEPFKLLV